MMSSLKCGVRGNAFTIASRSASEYSLVGQPEDVHLDTRRHQRDDRMHVLRNAGRRVQRDRRPHRLDVCLWNTVPLQEIPRRIGAVDLEALVGAAVGLGQAHVVKHRSRIEQFRIEFQARCSPASAPNR